jgi:hypothetical protein
MGAVQKQLIAAMVGLLAFGLLLAGCGGDSDSSTASISKAKFVKEASVACQKTENQIQRDYLAFLKTHSNVTKPTQAQYSELVSTVFVPNIEKEIAELQALGAPSGDEDQVEAFIDAREESIQIAEDNPQMLLTEGAKVTAKSAQIAKEYGLGACGNA